MPGARVLIGVAGCVAQAEGSEIMRRAPQVDLVVGPQSYQRLPDLAVEAAPARAWSRPSSRLPTSLPPLPGRPRNTPAASRLSSPCRRAATSSAHSVSFPTPAAPRYRGPRMPSSPKRPGSPPRACASSRCSGRTSTPGRVMDRMGRPGASAALLFRLAEIPGIDRLRYTTSHPRDMTDALIEAHRDLAALMPYLHLPVQSGLGPRARRDEPAA